MAAELAPVKVGQEVVVDIKGYAHQGEGVGRLKGFPGCGPGGVAGEEGLVRIELVKKKYARGEAVEVRKRSPHRVEPPCPLYGECGGCQFLHLDYPAQLECKQQRVNAALERLG